ncbi:hypothetical protein Tco_0371185 [Tanacetum coccineum]
MDPNTSIERLCLGVDDRVSLNDRIESKGQWDGSEFQDTADSEINLEYEKNMISNEFAIELLLDYEEKDGEKVVKKELLVALKGELYFVKFVINPEEDDVEPELYLVSPILASVDDSDLPQLDVTDVPIYSDEGPSLTVKKPLTQEEVSREDMEKDIYERIMILQEPRPIIENLKFTDQQKKLLDSVLLDKLKLDGEVELEEETATEEVIRSYKDIKEKNDPGVFVLHVRIKAKFDFHALADTGSNINVLPYRIYAKLGRDQVKPTSGAYDDEASSSSRPKITHATESVEEAMLELCHEFYATYEFEEEVTDEELMSKKLIKFRLCGRAHSLTILKFARRLGLYTNDEIQDDRFETYFHGGLRNDDHFNVNQYWSARNHEGYANVAWLIAKWLKRKGVGTQKESMICCGQFVTRLAKRLGVLTEEVLNGLSAPIYCWPLDTNTLRELIDSNGKLIAKDLAPGVPRVAIPRPPRPSIGDLYDRMGRMEIRQGELERMACRQSYNSNRRRMRSSVEMIRVEKENEKPYEFVLFRKAAT